MAGDKLIGNIIQVIAHDLRLRAYFQDIIADALDQCGKTSKSCRIIGAVCADGSGRIIAGKN